jgi:hypothetical protein
MPAYPVIVLEFVNVPPKCWSVRPELAARFCLAQNEGLPEGGCSNTPSQQRVHEPTGSFLRCSTGLYRAYSRLCHDGDLCKRPGARADLGRAAFAKSGAGSVVNGPT